MRFTTIRILFLTIGMMLVGLGIVSARNLQTPKDDISMGAQLYDKWFAALGIQTPEGNMPIWERQTTNSRSGADTWRCSECHGWDYKGSEGINRSGSSQTGFPNIMKLSAQMSEEEIIGHLKGSKDPSHNFSKYINDANLVKLAKFLKEGLPDDSASIDAATKKVISGNQANGRALFEKSCAECHGSDGRQKVFRTEGVNEYLGTIANRDPYRFLHRTRFGVAGQGQMPIGRDLGWKTSDSVDVLAYVQSLPSGTENEVISNAGASSQTSPKLGGPGDTILAGMFAGLAAILGMAGLSALFLLILVMLGVGIVWLLKKRK